MTDDRPAGRLLLGAARCGESLIITGKSSRRFRERGLGKVDREGRRAEGRKEGRGGKNASSEEGRS